MNDTDVAARLAEALTRMWEEEAGEPLDELDVFAETRDCYAAALLPVVREIADQRAAEELEAMARVFDADARNLVGGEAYARAAEDCRTQAAALRGEAGR